MLWNQLGDVTKKVYRDRKNDVDNRRRVEANRSRGVERVSNSDGRFVRSIQVFPLSMLRQVARDADAPTVKRLEKMVRLALHNRRIMDSVYYNVLRRQRKNIDAILD